MAKDLYHNEVVDGISMSVYNDTGLVLGERPKAAPVENKLADKFNTIYFSGAQCEVWIGDYQLEEAVEVEGQYSMEQIPIYGYASRHFGAVAQGRVIVSGSLIVNFKYDGYLYAHIKGASDLASKKSDVLDIVNKTASKDQSASQNILQPSINNPTDITQGIDKEVQESTALFTDISNADIAALQQSYWKKSETFDPLSAPPRPEFDAGPFNIKIKDYRVGLSKDSAPQEKELINCFINRYGTVRRVDGTPVVEVYTFICQTML